MKFEEFTVGTSYITSTFRFSEEDIIRYADQYDPLYLHNNRSAAQTSLFKGIIASGLQTMTVTWAEFMSMNILNEDCICGLGIDELRWPAPVYPNDQLVSCVTVIGKELLSDGKRGVVSFSVLTQNDKDSVVFSCRVKMLIACQTFR